jgi:transposase
LPFVLTSTAAGFAAWDVGASKDAAQVRRLLVLAAIYDGGTHSEAARLGGVTLQIVRDWVMRFNAEGPDGLINRRAGDPKPLLTDAHRQALAIQIDRGPIPTAWCAGVYAISGNDCRRSSASRSPCRR